MSEPWFCYMLRCKDGSFYVGITNDLEDRLREHSQGKDSAYTAKRRPVTLVWSEPHPNKESARRREIEIKGWTRKKKERLLLRAKQTNKQFCRPPACPESRKIRDEGSTSRVRSARDG